MKTKIVVMLVGFFLLLQTHGSTAGDTSTGGSQSSSSNNTQNNQATTKDPEASETAITSHENTDETNSPSSSAETNENDQNAENITGMSNSLADYVLDMLTHSNTSSDQTEGAATAGGNATQASESSSAASRGAGSTDGQTSGSAESSAGREGSGAQATSATPDTDRNMGAGKNGHDQWSDNEMTTTPKPTITTTPQRSITVDCTKEVDLRDYCGFTGPARDYFNNHTDVEGLRAPFIDMDIVQSLERNCRRGEWCLDNKLDVFRGMQDRFYEGPMCDDSMWKCIFDVILLRENCLNDGEFLLVVDIMDLLCNLPNKDNPLPDLSPSTEKDQTRCFAYVLAALHVTYADFLANDSLSSAHEKEVHCEGYGFRMTETYLCADNNCKGQYEARRAMEGFERWSWFMVNENTRMKNCDLARDTCRPLHANESTLTNTWFGMTTFAPFWTTTTVNGSAQDISGSRSIANVFGEDDQTLMVALIVGTAVGLLFIMLGLLFWRRSRRHSAYYYRSLADSYSEKGPSDEAHLLGRSTN